MVVPSKVSPETYKLLVNQKVGWLKFLETFSDENVCLQLYFDLKFSGHTCKKCGRLVTTNYVRISRKNGNGVPKKCFRCKSCHTYIYPLSDTLFRNSRLPLSSLFLIMFMMSDPKNSISAMEMSRKVGGCYKAIHRIMMDIRKTLEPGIQPKMKGIVEIDEAFLGKGSKYYNWSSISTRKQPIIGMVERATGSVRIYLVKDRKSATIRKLVLANVEIGSTVFTDAWRGYNCLTDYYTHESVDHSKREYVRGEVHTNNIESQWRRLKRNIRGAHIKITAKYVQQYVDECCWKNNAKGKTQIQLFDEVLVRSFFSGSARGQKKIKSLRGGKIAVVDPPRNLVAV